MLPRIIIPQPGVNPGGGRQPASVISDLRHILYVLYWNTVGLFLLCLPWMDIWENNYLLYLYPQFRPLVANSFFKGFVLGLGIVNILIGIHELANKRDYSKGILSK